MEFHHHPDNLIYIRCPEGDYKDTLENFQRDCASIGVSYVGKGDVEEVRYVPGIGRLSYKQGNQKFDIPVCTECETILSHLDEFIEAQELRKIADTPVPTEEDKRHNNISDALTLLMSTNWIVLRNIEYGIPIPPAIIASRKKAYDTIPEDYPFFRPF